MWTFSRHILIFPPYDLGELGRLNKSNQGLLDKTSKLLPKAPMILSV